MASFELTSSPWQRRLRTSAPERQTTPTATARGDAHLDAGDLLVAHPSKPGTFGAITRHMAHSNIGLDLTNTDAAHSVVPPLCLLSAFAAQANVGCISRI